MRALIYTRQSTDSQDNTRSTQEHDCSAWATSEGYEIAGSYHDEISGGVAPCERPSFCAMLDQLQAGDVIVAWRRDRIGRDLVENAVAHKLVERKGAKIITLDAPKDDTPESVMIRQMLDVIAQYEKAIISMRTKCALADRRRRGLVAGTPELGTQATEDGRIIPDAEEAVGRLQALPHVEGVSARAISEGMATLRDDGLAKALAGHTTLDEVLRVTQEDVVTID